MPGSYDSNKVSDIYPGETAVRGPIEEANAIVYHGGLSVWNKQLDLTKPPTRPNNIQQWLELVVKQFGNGAFSLAVRNAMLKFRIKYDVNDGFGPNTGRKVRQQRFSAEIWDGTEYWKMEVNLKMGSYASNYQAKIKKQEIIPVKDRISPVERERNKGEAFIQHSTGIIFYQPIGNIMHFTYGPAQYEEFRQDWPDVAWPLPVKDV